MCNTAQLGHVDITFKSWIAMRECYYIKYLLDCFK